jgi:ABC-type transport system substrate-binding protein
MNSKKKNYTLVGVLVVVALALTAAPFTMTATGEEEQPTWVWTKEYPKPSWWRWDETYFPTTPVRGGYLQLASTRYVGLMNPNHWPVNDWGTLASIYDRLLYPDGKHRPTVPWIAKSWKYEDDRTILMSLRKGITFHDGSLFDAHGLKYQIEWVLDKKNGAWSRHWIRPLESIEVVDDYTVRWHLKDLWASFFDMFANVPGWIISTKALKGDVALAESARLTNKLRVALKKLDKAEKKAEKAAAKGDKAAKKAAKKLQKAEAKVMRLEKQLKDAKERAKGAVPLDARAVGSGPFMVEEAKEGNYIQLKRNPDWWFGKSIGKPDMPYFDGRRVTVIPENSVKLANLKAGKIDSLSVEKSQYPQVKDDPNLRVWITPLNFTITLGFNQNSGPFKDIRMRKAVSHAINRKALIAANEGGFGRPASCLFPDDHFAHNPNLKPVSYDPELSKRLMAEAGYPNGIKVKGLIYHDSGSVRFGEIIKAMLKMVNISYEIEATDPVSYSDRVRNLEFDVTTFVRAYIKDPDAVLANSYIPRDSDRPSRSHNKKVISMIEAARKELNFEKRVKIYYDIEKVLYDNYEDAWLYYYTYISATRQRVLGYNREMSIEGGEAYWPTHPRWFKDGKRH